VSSSSYTYQYVYNGLGDRVRSVLDGVSTTYTLDLNSGLTQVLADASNTYLYGLSRISQTNEETTGCDLVGFAPQYLGGSTPEPHLREGLDQ
jgi:hypothetical protein